MTTAFEMLDQDGSCSISITELDRCAVWGVHVHVHVHVCVAFEMLDQDGSCSISITELDRYAVWGVHVHAYYPLTAHLLYNWGVHCSLTI